MHYFDELPNYRKAEIIFGQANYLNSIKYYGQTVMLYQLGKHLFEVFYNQEENEINEILLADNNRLHLYCPGVEEMK